ncbi:hypothetical protein [Pseudoalteromonas denitrificans]|uniref:Uncharacterized protein n=1 Tax=Pseudoalteromonas denitrificans DSM 6059 TaxID=1123010 RepID=A0A1I1T8A6_9GAMM|nr:hypothetical protein [Pseudoalteromonas denitrificans]SFD54822.1 hypothetical protein SAMN02745724_04815 [Pseudoalteromonas denitrificans DSM 6059]
MFKNIIAIFIGVTLAGLALLTIYDVYSNATAKAIVHEMESIEELAVQDALTNQKRLKGKAANAFNLCKVRASEDFGDKLEIIEVVKESPTYISFMLKHNDKRLHVQCSVAYDSNAIESFIVL